MPLKVCQLCAVDFTLKHFLTALIDGMQAQGWSVTSICSDGPFVPGLRAAGFRIETVPITRGLNPLKHAVSLLRLIRLLRRERFDLLHVHTPIAALLGRIAERHPGLKLTVDHMGARRGAKGVAAFPSMDALVALAKYSNVAVKLTGGPFYADDAYPFRSLHPHYRRMYDAFGPRRLFWGTDITKMPCSWKECVGHVQEIDWMPEADMRAGISRGVAN